MDDLKLDVEDCSFTNPHTLPSSTQGLSLSVENNEQNEQNEHNNLPVVYETDMNSDHQDRSDEQKQEQLHLYTFVNDEVAMMHTERFYSLKHSLMSVDSYLPVEEYGNMNDNEQQDRLLIASDLNAEFMKRNEMYTDSASAVSSHNQMNLYCKFYHDKWFLQSDCLFAHSFIHPFNIHNSLLLQFT